MEMNTRIQVEHPVTEMVIGADLIKFQILCHAGLNLPEWLSNIKPRGHSIECRINAENPDTFIPSPGQITELHAPGGLGVRVDSALYNGYKIPPNYDSLIAKLIVHSDDRTSCIRRLKRCLDEMVISGVETTIPLHKRVIDNDDFISGDYNIHWLEKFMSEN